MTGDQNSAAAAAAGLSGQAAPCVTGSCSGCGCGISWIWSPGLTLVNFLNPSILCLRRSGVGESFRQVDLVLPVLND